MWLTEAMIDAHRPTFGIAEDAMDPGKQDMRRHRADDFRFVLDVLQPGIARPAVTDRRATWNEVGADKGAERVG